MEHLTDGRIAALIDGELGGEEPARPGAAEATASGPTRDDGFSKVLKTAAAVVALLGAGAVAVDAALPGSRLRDLVVEAVRGDSEAEPEPGPEGVPAETALPARRGLAVSPVEGRIELVVRRAAEGTRIHVARTEEDRARISAPGGRFRTDPGRLEVVEPAGGDILVSVPLGTEEWRLVVNGRTALRGSTGRIVRPDSGRVEWIEEGARVVVAGPPRR